MMVPMIYGNITQSESTYEWSIDKFSNICKTIGESIISPVFSLVTNNEFSWQLQLYPYGVNEEGNGYISIYLRSKNDFTVEVSYGFAIKNANSLGIKKEIEYTFKPLSTDGFGFRKYAERNEVIDNIKHSNDLLILKCNFHDVTVIQNFDNSRIGNSKFEVCNDIKQLFINQDFCDVTLKVNGKEIRAHKLILSARSKVFAAMFNHNMIENVENIVEIEDVDCEVLEVMLKFIYSGEIENTEKITKELLVAADKYAIDGLKNICILKLSNAMNIDNAVDLLQFADFYNFTDFKKSLMDFIVTNAKDIIEKPTFKLLKNMPDVLLELFSKYVSNTKT